MRRHALHLVWPLFAAMALGCDSSSSTPAPSEKKELMLCNLGEMTAYKAPDRPFCDQNARRNLGASRASGSCHDVVVTTTECRSLGKCRQTRGSA